MMSICACKEAQCSCADMYKAQQLPVMDIDVLMDAAAVKKAAAGDDIKFFELLAKQVAEVALKFEEEALRLVELDKKSKEMAAEQEAEARKWNYKLKRWFGWRSKTVRPEVCLEDVADKARMVREYARYNADALSKVLNEYDEHHDTGTGLVFLKKCKSQRGRDNFLRSWLLDELKALDVCYSKAPRASMSTEDLGQEFGDLTCGICMDLCYKPVKLGCGHRLCAPCLQRIAKSSTLVRIKHLPATVSCPFCRQEDVCSTAVELTACDYLARTKWPEEYNERELVAKRRRAQDLVNSIAMPLGVHHYTVARSRTESSPRRTASPPPAVAAA